MKKLILLLTVLLTGLLTTELRAQFPIYGDLIVYGQADFSKNLTVDSTITAIYLIVDSIKLADSSVTSCYSGTLVNTTYVDDVIGAYYIFDNGLTESGGNVDLGGTYSNVTLNGSGSSNFTINAETTYNDGIYIGFAGGSSVKTAIQGTTSGGDPVYFILNDNNSQEILMRQGSDTEGEVTFNTYGLSYGADISSRNTSNDRWLTDKGYVDNKVISYTFDNGLTESGGNVDLGDFTAHVDIDGGGFNYLFETLNYGYGGGFNFYPTTPLARFYMEISGGARKELLMAYTSGGIEIIDNIDNMGLYYDADYSANSTARWCTDRAYVDSYYSGSLTDGAPTDAELDAAIGSTPSGVGANRKFLVKDTDGTGLYYDVISDGSNWIYFPGKSGSTAL